MVVAIMDYDATVTNKWRMLVIGAALSPLKFSKWHMFVFGVALSPAIIFLSKSILQTHMLGSAF